MTRSRIKKLLFCLTLTVSCITSVQSFSEASDIKNFTFSSSTKKTDTVVLFTSQGCSSCPPAEKWLNSYNQSPELWKTTIPLAFHVDYWDYLGWKDPFAKKEFSKLQRKYARQKHVASVYTPGILVNNNEFRQWFYGRREWSPSSKQPGILSVKVNGQTFEAGFQSAEKISNEKFELHTAWLGMGIATKVTAGENSGRTLDHDFVVLDYENHGNTLDQTLKLEPAPRLGQLSSVMVVWITRPGSVEIIQAAAYPV